MENKNLVGVIIAVAVGIIMIGSLLAGVVAGYSEETKIYTNEGVTYSAYDDEEHTIVISMDSDGDLSILTDGETAEVPDFTLYGSATIVYGNDGLVRLGSAGQLRAFNSTGVGTLTVDADTTVTITVTSDGVSMTDGTSTPTLAFTPSAYISSTGDYALCVNPCVTDESIIIAGVTNFTTSDYAVFTAYGTVDSLTVAVPYAYIDGASATVSSVSAEVNTSEVTTNLLKIDSVVFTAEIDSEEYTGTYSYFLAPSEVEYENPEYVGSEYVALLVALVTFIILAILMIPTRFINRDD